MTFHVGQKVVCVDVDPWVQNGTVIKCQITGQLVEISGTLDGLTEGAVYTIRAFGRSWTDGSQAIFLEEIVRSDGHIGETPFAIRRFRPAVERKTDISIFTKMLKPKQRETT